MDPKDCDGLDLRAVWRAMPSYGPDWDAAIELGIDVESRLQNTCLPFAND